MPSYRGSALKRSSRRRDSDKRSERSDAERERTSGALRRDPFAKKSSSVSSRTTRRSKRPSDRKSKRASDSASEDSRVSRSREKRPAGASPIMIYGGAGAVAVLVLGSILITGATGSTAVRANGVAHSSHTAPSDYHRPLSEAKPYGSVSEAASKLNEAFRLYRQGEQRDGAARNRYYRDANHICRRVLATPGLPENLVERAGTLNYTTFKLQTN